MLHAREEIVVHAPPSAVAALYRDYAGWPKLFPATIRGVRLLRIENGRTHLEIDHREGKVLNVMTDVSDARIDLWEAKRRYDATFINRFEPTAEGTRYAVEAAIELKGAARLLAPVLGPLVRRQLRRYVLEPVRRAAERSAR